MALEVGLVSGKGHMAVKGSGDEKGPDSCSAMQKKISPVAMNLVIL